MLVVITLLFAFLASAILCHALAKKRGKNPVFWGVLGAMFGPIVIPFAWMPKRGE